MADLPEHMAQVAIWKHLDDLCYAFDKTFELRLATPYLLTYVLMRALAVPLSVSAAGKVTVWLTIMLLPLALRSLLMRGRGDVWWSLLGFPLAYGYAFYWGFLNFSLAIPIGIFYLAFLYDERAGRAARHVLAIALLSAHALLFFFCAVVTIAVAIVKRSRSLVLPLVAPMALFLAFLVGLGREPSARGTITWKLSASRFTDLTSLFFANAWEPLGLVLVAVIAAAIAITRPALTRDRARWMPLAVAALLYFFAPFGAYGSAYIAPRFATLTALGILFVFEEPTRARTAARIIIVTLVVGWMAVLAVRFHRFASEARELETMLEAIPANRRVIAFNVLPFSDHVPGPVFWHAGALYQVRRGGLTAWSFARWYPQIVRYRAGAEPIVRSESTPVDGIDWPGVLQFDYLLVRGGDVRRWMFRDAPVPIALRARHGAWWLFETPHARGPQRDCAPLDE